MSDPITRPKRIQMSRQHPWRADNPDAIIVARPSQFGNRFRISRERCEEGPKGFCWAVRRDGRATWQHYDTKADARAGAVDAFREYIDLSLYLGFDRADVQLELAGRNLACWCPLDQPCHADVLLELANGDSRV